MSLLYQFRQDVAEPNLEMGTVILESTVLKHRHNRSNRVFPYFALLWNGVIEGSEFREATAFTQAKLNPAVADQIESSHAFGDAGWMIGGQLNDAVTETDILGALASSTQKHFRCRAVGIFLEKMMLNHPGVVDAQSIRQFYLIEGVLEQLLFRTHFPGAGQLQLIENAEFHGRLSLTAAEHAAIDDQLVTVDIPSLVRRQIERRKSHILDLAETPQRH